MEAHYVTADELDGKKSDLTSAQSKHDKANADLNKAKKDLDLPNKRNDGHALTLTNKDMELLKVREELKVARGREAEAIAKYRKSMDFVTRLANHYNGGWAATVGVHNTSFLTLTGSRRRTLMVARILKSRSRARSLTLGSLRRISLILTRALSLERK